ncbi:hypothetical protein [Devosia sp. DBB001]|nr:hypothetical protein [Devosia sp. DBB001]
MTFAGKLKRGRPATESVTAQNDNFRHKKSLQTNTRRQTQAGGCNFTGIGLVGVTGAAPMVADALPPPPQCGVNGADLTTPFRSPKGAKSRFVK